jgi:hypothetical protein
MTGAFPAPRLIATLAVVVAAAAGSAPLSPVIAQDLPAAASRMQQVPDSVRTTLAALRARGDLGPIATLDSVMLGSTAIAAGDTVRGSLVVYGGPLELGGVIDGSVAVVGGDLIMLTGALVTGSASTVGGAVRLEGGQVGGEIRSITSSVPGAAAAAVDALDPSAVTVVPEPDAAARTWRSVRFVATSFGLFLVLGIGILVFSQPTLDLVVRSLEDRFASAFWTGLLAQFALLPLLLLIVTALTLSVVGILLIPFAVVAYAIAVAGVLALGFLAAARLTGGAFGRGASATARGAALRAMVAGLLVYFGVWMVAAGLSWHPLAGTAARAIALSLTWVAVTVGLGAIIAAGLAARRARAESHLPRAHADALAWQTPTPITGVVAAARPSISVRRGA